MALQKEIWISDIQEQLFQGAEFVMSGTDHSAFISNKTVHVPQAGALPNIAKNRSSYPATISQRTDSELTYQLNEFTTDPILITDIDELQTSYAKRQSVLSSNIGVLNDRIALETANAWCASGSASLVISTSGDATADLANATATGTRKKVTKEDIAKMARKLDMDNVSRNDRFLVMPTSMYYELFETDALIRRDFGGAGDIVSGVVNELFGFKIFVRPDVVLFDGSNDKKAVGEAEATTDCLGAIAYQRSAVAHALGSIKAFADEDKPEYYGSVFSALVMHGSSALRSDNKGIVALQQAIGA